METITMIRLTEHDERKLIDDKALPHIGVGFTREGDDREFRVMRRLAQGDTLTRDDVQFALDVLDTVVQACDEQTDPAWWEATYLTPAPTGPGPWSPGGTSVVLDPARFCADMADNRRAQLRDAREARELVARMRALL